MMRLAFGAKWGALTASGEIKPAVTGLKPGVPGAASAAVHHRSSQPHAAETSSHSSQRFPAAEWRQWVHVKDVHDEVLIRCA